MRFLHTADWHLGMSRRFLPPDAQARFDEARLQAVRDIAALATREQCAFVVACGDVFDSNHVDRQVVARALDAMASFEVPLFILPGNHDPLDAGSVYRSHTFTGRVPDVVTVIDDALPIDVAPGIQVVGAPWATRRPGRDLAAAALEGLESHSGITRILVAHGAVDSLSPDADDPALIHVEALRHALYAGAVDYVALGDRHSAGQVGDDPRIRYSGTPVATDHGEVEPGMALVVQVDPGGMQVHPHRVGEWHFMRIEARLDGLHDIDALDAQLDATPDKARAVVRLALVGTLSVAEDARLQEVLDHHGDVMASLTVSEGRSDLAVHLEDGDIAALGLTGYAHDAAAELAALADADGPDQQAARDALRLLNRLAAGA
jgi:DNA repair exonuclease SbcCD nuclease subunit